MNQRVTTEGLRSANELAGLANTQLTRNIGNAQVAASMAVMPSMVAKWETSKSVVKQAGSYQRCCRQFFSHYEDVKVGGSVGAIGIGAYLAIVQEISPGMVIAGSILIGRALQPVEQSVAAWKGFVDFKSQYDRTNDLLNNYPLPTEKMPLPPNYRIR